MMKSTQSAAVILAAGQGKRMDNPSLAKVMHPLGGIPLIGHVVALARLTGAARIIAVVGNQRESVIDYLKTFDFDVEIAVQDQQLGTGHAVRQTESLLKDFEGNIVILSGDAPLTRPETIERMLARHRESGAVVTVLTARLPDPAGYGRVLRDDAENILRIVEHKDASKTELLVDEINSGIYVFEKRPLFEALAEVRNDNAQGEYYLPDVFSLFGRQGRKMVPLVVDSFDEIRGVNTVQQLEELERLYLRQ